MFWELYQQGRIKSAQDSASAAREVAESTKNNIQALEDKIDGLSLVCQAMFEVLAGKLDVSQQEIEAKMEEIDLRDGRADGKMSTETLDCKNCKRRVNNRRQKCLFCGEPIPGTFFGKT